MLVRNRSVIKTNLKKCFLKSFVPFLKKLENHFQLVAAVLLGRGTDKLQEILLG